MNELVAVDLNQARVNLTYSPNGISRNVDLPDPVSIDISDDGVLRILTEAVRAGGVPGIPADPNANFERNFVVERIPPSEQYPYNRMLVRPKVPFGVQG